MQYRTLGNTGLLVSVVGFGASPLGNVFGSLTTEEVQQAVSHAIASGINLFDVSPYYGHTFAEERLGQALSGSRERVVLATKCGRYGADHFDFSAETVTQQFEASLRRLQTDHVDLLQAHDVEFGDLEQIVNETIPAMRKLQEQGKVRSIGITGYWPGFLARIARRAEVDCMLNYCHANLFVDDMDVELTRYAEQANVGLLNASPLHMGLLAKKPIPPWHPAPARVREAALQVREICEAYGADAGTLAMYTCLQHPVVASTFVGISSRAEVDAACAALEWLPPSGLVEAVQDALAPVKNCAWTSGREENWDAGFTNSISTA